MDELTKQHEAAALAWTTRREVHSDSAAHAREAAALAWTTRRDDLRPGLPHGDSADAPVTERKVTAAAVPGFGGRKGRGTSPVTERRVTAAAVPGFGSRKGRGSPPVTERRTTTAAVVFLDIVGYTKQPDSKQIEWKQQFSQLLTNSLDPLGTGERIILDTGDGAAIGFLQHPTDALESAMLFRTGLTENKHDDHPDLRVRIGIHLGPVSLVKDMNGQINMLGDGINSAQRVMGFAGEDQIYVSRAYFEFVSNLSDEYKDLFRYRGSHQDKHGREFHVYELLDVEGTVDELVQVQPIEPSNSLGAFNLEAFDTAFSQPEEPKIPERQETDVTEQQLVDAVLLAQVKAVESVVAPAPSQPVNQAEVGRTSEEQADLEALSEAEDRKLADAQAKKWTEAEQRSVEMARKNVESANRKVLQPPVGVAPVARSRRKPVPWGRLGTGLLVLVLVALFVVPAVLPMQGYQASIERALGSRLQQPVHIGHLAMRILPTPRLVLSDVSVGDAKQIKVQLAQVNFAFSALFGQAKSINSLGLDGVQVNGAALPQVAGWLQQVAGDHQYPVARIALTQGQLDADGMQFSAVDGELNFDPSGKFTQARLNAIEHKLALDIRVTPAQKLQLSITLHDSALPSLPNWVFEELKATGELTRDELRITDLDGRIREGGLTGDVRINWRSGWRVQGALVARAIPLQNINKLLSGDLDGTAHFQMQAASLSKLADAAVLNGVFNAKKGVISGVDVVEVARLHSRESLPGGRTHFDELSGELFYANDSYRFSQLKMRDNVVKAGGTLTIARQQLAGNISADLTMHTGMGTTALQVSGTTESPSLRAVR